MSEKTRLQRFRDGVLDLPSNTRMAAESAWRGRERGLAIIAGVFLASLVITTVLAYGNGLSQTFLQFSIENDVYDAKVEQLSPPPGPDGDFANSTFTNDTSLLVEVCLELSLEEEIADCTLTFGRQAIRQSGVFGNIEAFDAGYLSMESVTSSNPLLENESFDFPEASANGPPVFTKRMLRLLGPGAFDGELAERHEKQMLNDIPWPSHQDMIDNRSVILPASIAGPLGVKVNDTIESLDFGYVLATAIDPEKIDRSQCSGFVEGTGGGLQHCREIMVVENLTISGIYEDWQFGNPTFGFNPIFMSWSILDNESIITLMDSDHGYLGIAVDRSLLPTSSTSDAEDWLTRLSQSVMYGEGSLSSEPMNYSGGIQLFWYDTISGTITFLEIFLGLIQTFDYILMIPIIILSLAILVYGLVLSLEQRRREIAIHRTIGGSSGQLQSMVLREVLVMSSVAWLLGFIFALQAVRLVLAAVGFMEFEELEFDISVKLGFTSILFTAICTIGAALLFGNNRTKEFLELEIDEGVRKVPTRKKPKTTLHVIMFLIGSIAVFEAWIEDSTGESGFIENFFIDGLIGLFGPFLLWIGGALILGRIASWGPRFFSLMFGWTPLLKDIRRGLKTGGGEAIGRLATIMVLTLSIVTLAAVQGATGTLVDERTADANTGSVLSIQFNETINSTQAEFIVQSAIQDIGLDVTTVSSTAVPAVAVSTTDGSSTIEAWVVLDGNENVLLWSDQSIPGDDIQNVVDGWANGGFTAGESASFKLRLPDTVRRGLGDTFEPKFEDKNTSEQVGFISTSARLNISTPNFEDLLSQEAIGPIFEEYPWRGDLSLLDLSGSDLSDRDLRRTNFSGTNLAYVDFSGSDLKKSVFFYSALNGANLSNTDLTDSIMGLPDDLGIGNPLAGVNLSGADMTGMAGVANLSGLELGNATCPDGSAANVTNCASGLMQIPPEHVIEILAEQSTISVEQSEFNVELNHLGRHRYLPGLPSAEAEDKLIIGESTYRILTDMDANSTITSTTWYFWVGSGNEHLADSDADGLTTLRVQIESNESVTGVSDLTSAREAVERNGGLIFGTPGLLSLQFVVAAIGSVASAFVFLSLVLSQRKKEMAILQAIGASPRQVMRLVLFEILAIVIASMLLGLILGAGVAQSFNGFFSIFGFIFQIFGGASTVIERELIWPWFDLAMVSVAVLVAVVLALTLTTAKALRSDLAIVLKGE
ncbi:MAG: FtsX-like permease family protein [Candidatus Thalassarchaeaceae archaeon]|nr:FtsX-like permease family protein [Candidatus Thalassarchaeaceae archaeon]